MGITTHVLDTARGKPAAGVPVALEVRVQDGWQTVGRGMTDADGRLRTLTDGHEVRNATYAITFETDAYFTAQAQSGFYPVVRIEFRVTEAGAHHHVPLLLSPFGFSTYRGS